VEGNELPAKPGIGSAPWGGEIAMSHSYVSREITKENCIACASSGRAAQAPDKTTRSRTARFATALKVAIAVGTLLSEVSAFIAALR